MKIIKVGAVWCPGCIIMNPIWKKFKKEYSDYEIIEYDYDKDEEQVKNLKIGLKLPVTIFMDDNNEEIDRLIGEKTYKELIKKINNIESK